MPAWGMPCPCSVATSLSGSRSTCLLMSSQIGCMIIIIVRCIKRCRVVQPDLTDGFLIVSGASQQASYTVDEAFACSGTRPLHHPFGSLSCLVGAPYGIIDHKESPFGANLQPFRLQACALRTLRCSIAHAMHCLEPGGNAS